MADLTVEEIKQRDFVLLLRRCECRGMGHRPRWKIDVLQGPRELARESPWPSLDKGAPAAPWGDGVSRDKVGRNKATILTFRLCPRDADHIRSARRILLNKIAGCTNAQVVIVDYMCPVDGSVIAQIDSKAVKPIAVLRTKRLPILPKLPTATGQGLTDFDTSL
jgi:hypothetical protein